MKLGIRSKRKLLLLARYTKHSALEALAAVLLFSVVYFLGSKYDLVRSNAVDTAFNYMELLHLSSVESNDANHTPISVFEFDREYLSEKGLLDRYNEVNYGYLFPREKLADFIEKIDRLSPQKQPLALFVDYDMKYGALPGGKLSGGDHTFLSVLAKERGYRILLPKTGRANFVEAYALNAATDTGKAIKAKIDQKKIIFVNVDFLSSGGKVMRYSPMRRFPDSNRTYYNVGLVIWQLTKNSDINISEIHEKYDPDIFLKNKKVTEGAAIIRCNILIKEEIEINKEMNEYDSYWGDLHRYSASYHFGESGFFNRTIVMLGGLYRGQDAKKLGTGDTIPGIELHAQVAKTVLFADGPLQRIFLLYGFLIIFGTYFLTSVILHFILSKYPTSIRFFAGLGILSFTFFWISSHLLIEYKIWFNWVVPILFFYADDVGQYLLGAIRFFKNYRAKQINMENLKNEI